VNTDSAPIDQLIASPEGEPCEYAPGSGTDVKTPIRQKHQGCTSQNRHDINLIHLLAGDNVDRHGGWTTITATDELRHLRVLAAEMVPAGAAIETAGSPS